MKFKYLVHLEIGYTKTVYEFTADDLAVNFMITLMKSHKPYADDPDKHYAVWMDIAPVDDKNIYKEEVKYESEF